MPKTAEQITQLLKQHSSGDPEALEKLLPEVYTELRRLARGYLSREKAGHTLAPTALVHEAFMRFLELKAIDFQSRAHFFAVCATFMRRILINHARDRSRKKRGGGELRVTFDENIHWSDADPQQLLDLNDAMERLAVENARAAKTAEMRCFGGLTVEEIATVTGISKATVKRDWLFAKAWLFRELNEK
jgi:RNA polymerase sigma factor (TIGR02999 family)